MARDQIPTGFPSLDRLLSGGMRRGELVVLGGDVGSGKSALALAIAMRVAAAGGHSGFFSAEMPPARVRERMRAMEERVAIASLRDRETNEEGNIGSQPGPGNERDPVIAAIPAAAGADSVIARLLELATADLVVVDNLQALPSDRSTSEEEAAYAVRRLKSAAIEKNTVVLLVAQCSVLRTAASPVRPTLRDFAALGAVAHHADVALAVHREEMYDRSAGLEGATELHVLKNRRGTTGYADLYFYSQWLRFEDMVEPGQEKPGL